MYCVKCILIIFRSSRWVSTGLDPNSPGMLNVKNIHTQLVKGTNYMQNQSFHFFIYTYFGDPEKISARGIIYIYFPSFGLDKNPKGFIKICIRF